MSLTSTNLRKSAAVLTLVLTCSVACSKKPTADDHTAGTTTVHQAGVSSTRPLGALLEGLDFLAAIEKTTTTEPQEDFEKNHLGAVKSLLKDLQETKSVRTQALAELELENILKKSALAPQTGKASDLKKELASFLGSLVPISFDVIKLAVEEKIESKLGTKILYNKDATDPLAIYLSGKMQSSSGTTFFNLARLYSLPAEQHAVWIYTNGHMLPGVVKKSGEIFELEGIETTALGVALIRFGALTALDEPIRIVHADLATLLDLVQPYVSKEDHKDLSLKALQNTATFYQLPLDRLTQNINRQIESSISARRSSTESQTGMDETEFPLSFGAKSIEAGDQQRTKAHSRRNIQSRGLNRSRSNENGTPSLEEAYPNSANKIPKEGKWVLVGKEAFDDKLKAQGISPPQKILGDGHDLKCTSFSLLSIDETKVCFSDPGKTKETATPATFCLEFNPTTNLFELYVEGEPPHVALATYVLRVAD